MKLIKLRIRTIIPLVITGILLGLHILAPSRATFFVLLVLAGVHAVSYYWARQLSTRIRLQRMHRYGWAQVGDVIEERFVLHNDAWLSAVWLTLVDRSDLPGYHVNRALGIGGHSSLRWSTEGSCSRRGIYTLGPTDLYTGDPFGLYEVHLRHDYQDSFIVYPPIAALPPIIEPRGMERGEAHAQIRSLDLTTNSASVRQYVPGDALNRIAWRATARRSTGTSDNIYVKEFDLEPSGDQWFLMDMNHDVHFGDQDEASEELAVVLVASFANQLLLDNHAVGIATHDRDSQVLPPGKGHGQLWQLLRLLAGLYARSNMPLGELIELVEPVIRRGVTVTIVTPSANPEWIDKLGLLLRRGIHVTALLIDNPAMQGTESVTSLVGALAELNVVAHVVDNSLDLQIVNEHREQRPSYKVLGTGRVVSTPGSEAASAWVNTGEQS
ncbi:MAG: DUF58 domain-containing protein [Chloroflexi bacterium]|nr:DUF58 domain-containing protein [Chloroflexota bacterium]